MIHLVSNILNFSTMPTLKKRINISLPSYLEESLNFIAARDGVPVATKALEFLKEAMELHEDMSLNAIAEKRDTKDAKFLSHNEIW